jgi:hypothetical protein
MADIKSLLLVWQFPRGAFYALRRFNATGVARRTRLWHLRGAYASGKLFFLNLRRAARLLTLPDGER